MCLGEKVNTNHIEKMMEEARIAMNRAYAPYSNFRVGACIKTHNNKFFVGSNVENLVYPSSQCAEASAIGSMIVQDEKRIDEIVVMGSGDMFCAPCGNCRQMIREHASDKTKIHICNSTTLLKTVLIGELLPFSFATELMIKNEKNYD